MRPLQAVIDIAAIRHNLRHAKRLSGHARIAAAVKADAYGHGAQAILPALTQADWLAVASIDEAIQLRDAGTKQPILLLEGVFEASEYELCGHLDFEVVIHHPNQLAMLAKTNLTSPLRVWLKFDSGMSRLGLATSEFKAIFEQLLSDPGVAKPIRLMTHFCAADDPDPKATNLQWQNFTAVAGGREALLSAANSGAILFHPSTHADIVRPGIMLYGAGPDPQRHGQSLGLRPAMRLQTKIIALRQLETGCSVGYGWTWQAQRPSVIATIAAGYGDGYPRAASNKATALVGDHEVPIVGRVSMDMITLDVTDLDRVDIGDPVLLFGSELPVERLAAAAGTIAYEVTCSITRRVPKTYVDHADTH